MSQLKIEAIDRAAPNGELPGRRRSRVGNLRRRSLRFGNHSSLRTIGGNPRAHLLTFAYPATALLHRPEIGY